MKKIGALVLALLTGMAGIGYADSTPALYPSDSGVMKRLDELANQLSGLQKVVENQNEVIRSQSQEIDALKMLREGQGKSVYLPTEADKKAAGKSSWTEGIRQGGDFRLRYEGYDNRGETGQDRNRFRMRLRYGIEKDLNDEFTVGFRIATSGTAVENTSTLQTMGSDFTNKAVYFDRLFVKYAPTILKDRGIIAKTEFGGGKVDNPFNRGHGMSQMIWDPDVTPEGIYEMVDFQPLEIAGSQFSPFALAGQFPLTENAAVGSSDAELYGYMAGFNANLNVGGMEKPIGWLNSISYYDFQDYAKNGNFIVSGTSFARGNSVDPANANALLAKDFNILSFHNEFKLPTPWVPTTPFFTYATNLGDVVGSLKPGNLNNAWGWGVRFGETKKKGDWDAAYYYYYIEPNSIVGAFSDSDFGGPNYTGFADRRGSAIKLGYKLTDFLTLNFSSFFVDTVTHRPSADTNRYTTDLNWKF